VRAADLGHEFISIDVGCNTGINSAVWLAQFGGNPDVARGWSEGLKTAKAPTGACHENFQNKRSRAVAVLGRDRRAAGHLAAPRAICVEPMPANINLINTVKAQVLAANGLEVVHAAASNSTGTASFPVGDSGQENLGLSSGVVTTQRAKDVQVDVITIDKLVEDRNLDHVDVLTIDTEGHDPAALQGARKTLREKGVGLLVFEVHQDILGTPWSHTTLFSVVEELASLHFDCYWARVDGHLKRLTDCWNAEREEKFSPIGWSNVACARYESHWHRAFEKYVV
jgi:FkbM family methyltransferase